MPDDGIREQRRGFTYKSRRIRCFDIVEDESLRVFQQRAYDGRKDKRVVEVPKLKSAKSSMVCPPREVLVQTEGVEEGQAVRRLP